MIKMKNLISLATVLFFLVATVAAQELATSSSVLTSKKGTPILPEAGDVAVGVGAYPFLYFIGNMFNNTEDNELDLYESTLYGRYYLADDAAIQVGLYVDKSKNTYNYYVRDDAAYFADNTSRAQVVDQQIYTSNSFGLDLSYLKFRGYGRLRGYYGGAIGYGYSTSRYEYTYGNAMTATNTSPSTYIFGNTDNRPLYSDNGISQNFGLGIIAGVEYFFMPKACIGFDLTLSYRYYWSSQADTKYEHWNVSGVEEIVTPTSPGNKYRYFDTYLPAFGDLYLMFHF